MTYAYHLDRDVLSLTAPLDDDRVLDLRLRGANPSAAPLALRLHGDDELRAWSEGLIHDRLVSTTEPAEFVELSHLVIAADDVHGHRRRQARQGDSADGTEYQPATFVYSQTRPPHTACNTFLENVRGDAFPVVAWFSHGGMCVSFAVRPSHEILHVHDLGKSDTAGAIAVGSVEFAGCSSSGLHSSDGCRDDCISCIGVYVSDFVALEHDVRHTVDSYMNRFRLVVKLRDGGQLRFCCSLRSLRATFQWNVIGIRNAMQPEQMPIQINAAMRRSPYTTDGSSHGEEHSQEDMFHLPGMTAAVDARRDQEAVADNDDGVLGEGLCGCLEIHLLSGNTLGLKTAPNFADLQPKQSLLENVVQVTKESVTASRSKGHLPIPQLTAYVQAQPSPVRPEIRKTPDAAERTANPTWNCTWRFLTEYFPGDAIPPDIRLEVYDVGGRNGPECLGEITLSFPTQACTVQHCSPLVANPVRISESWKIPTGIVSLQVSFKHEMHRAFGVPRGLLTAFEVDARRTQPMTPNPLDVRAIGGPVCGTLRVEILRGIGLASADFLTSDPYCLVQVGHVPRSTCTWRTTTKLATLNPVWCEAHEFTINWPRSEVRSAPPVRIDMYDQDQVSNDEFLGEATFPLPQDDCEELLDIYLRPNRGKGLTEVKGHIQVRVIFQDQFRLALEREVAFTEYETAFCSYFGTRPVDEQLARALAPPLAYFHLSGSRLLEGHLRDALSKASFGLVRARSGNASVVDRTKLKGTLRVRRFADLCASLWVALAFTAALLAAVGAAIGWEATAMRPVAVGLGFFVGVLLPCDVVKFLATFLWHSWPPLATTPQFVSVGVGSADIARPAASPPLALQPPALVAATAMGAACGGIDISQDTDAASRVNGMPFPFTCATTVVAWVSLACYLGRSEDAYIEFLAWASVALLFERLVLAPLVCGLSVQVLVLRSREGATYDWAIERWPSLIAVSGVRR
eukprot:TRINITY_DN67969_c0_g1_i1.p1 TRINITY_DN67969_c0_g1~~TRINITY_DN67969_c0_g1_i1.p1  ORF type:complete len:968 (+),score=112.20 TRINITY_DN67969_c0_g1_i1:3-2906(+)